MTTLPVSKLKGNPPHGARTIAGLLGGAVVGFLVGGPAGAMFGMAAGLIIGAAHDVSAFLDEW